MSKIIDFFKLKKKDSIVQSTKDYINSLPEFQREMAIAAMGLGKSGKVSRNELKNLFDSLEKYQIDRRSITIKDWRNALESAESSDYPDRLELAEIFKDVIDDYQVISGMNNRTNAVALSKYGLKNADGSTNEEATKVFSSYFTYQFIQLVMKSFYYGCTDIQVTWDKNTITEVKEIPFENIAPEFKAIKKNAGNGVTTSNLIILENSIYKDSVIEVFRDRKDLGLLNKAVPYYIWKKVFGAWSQHADLFGMDTRIVKTDLIDTDRKKSAIEMLKSMGRAPWGVFDLTDEIQNIGGRSDAFNIYERLINVCDAAISKIFVGQTGTTDEKAYSGSSNVHKEIFDQYTASDKIFVQNVIQSKWIPLLEKLKIIPVGLQFFWDESKEISIMDKTEIIAKLAPYFKFTPEFIESYLGIQVEDKEILSSGEKLFNNVAKLYLNK